MASRFAPLLLATACGSSGSGSASSTCGSTGLTGSLAIQITGLPSGINASVSLVGPAGSQSVTASTTLMAAAGSYTVIVGSVTQADPIVRKAFRSIGVTGNATVCAGQTNSITVAYGLIPTSNTLWWGNANGSSDTLGYAASTLGATGTPSAGVTANTQGSLPGAFDLSGNLWLLDGTAGSVGVKRYPADAFASGGTKTPDVVLSSDALTGGSPGPVSVAFDAFGNLWVGILYSQSVIEFAAANLGASAKLTPTVTLGNVPAPNGLAFDPSGDLWVASGDNVVEYFASRLGGSTSAAPDVSIAAQTPPPVVGPLTAALGLAFDVSHNLWVNYSGTLARFTVVDQTMSGTLTPGIQIQPDVLALPEGIAFDESGGLWMAYSAGKFCKFGASQLTASGSVVPEVVITSSSLGSATSPAFFPGASGLPLYSSIP